MSREPANSGRKTYEPPALIAYGNIMKVVRAVATATKTADGGTGQMNKTA